MRNNNEFLIIIRISPTKAFYFHLFEKPNSFNKTFIDKLFKLLFRLFNANYIRIQIKLSLLLTPSILKSTMSIILLKWKEKNQWV